MPGQLALYIVSNARFAFRRATRRYASTRVLPRERISNVLEGVRPVKRQFN